jgi:RNA polymerase sigma-70 factor, ECF subfamily
MKQEQFHELITALRQAHTSLDDPLVLHRLMKRIQGECQRRLGSRDRLRRVMDSQDLGQNVLFELVRSIDDFRGEDWESFLGFVRRIIDNRIKGAARRATAARRDLEREARASEAPELRFRGAGPHTQNADREDATRLRQLVGELPDDYRQVMTLRFEGHDYAEIARQLDLTEPAVRKRFSRALNMLRESLPPGPQHR